MDWVIDTDVLVRADRLDDCHDHWNQVFGLLHSIDRKHDYLAVDGEDIIKAQYDRTISRSGWVYRFVQKFISRGQILYVSGRLTNRLASRLRSLHFDSDDDVFVAVATRTSSHRLVAEESDYTDPVVEHLQTVGVYVVDCRTALSVAEGQ